MAVMAKNNPGMQFTLFDSNPDTIALWISNDEEPIHEPGLHDLLQEVKGRNLSFVGDEEFDVCVSSADIVFMAVGVKNKEYGIGKDKALDLSSWEENARRVAPHLTGDKLRVVCELSTVPVKACAMLSDIIPCCGATAPIEVVSNPAFMSSGTALRDLMDPERILLGGASSPQGQQAIAAVASLYTEWVPAERIIRTQTWSAELAKLSTNAFIAQRISSINAVAAVCEATGAEVGEVSEIVGMDSRISSKFLQPSVGFGGQALTRILVLVYMCESLGLHDAAKYWQSVIDINEYSKKKFARTMISRMFNTVSRKKIAILGFAFKANTTDTRESAAIAVCRELLAERATICIYDPKANKAAILKELTSDADKLYERDPSNKPDLEALVTVAPDAASACDGAHAIAILTEWEEFKTLDYAALYSTMVRPAYVFDGRRVVDCAKLAGIGFSVYQVGAGTDGAGA